MYAVAHRHLLVLPLCCRHWLIGIANSIHFIVYMMSFTKDREYSSKL